MAFQTNRSSVGTNTNKSAPVATTAVRSEKSDSINVGGMYEGKPDSKLVLKGGALKESITIPAGYVAKVFKKGGLSKNGKQLPPYEIVFQAPQSK